MQPPDRDTAALIAELAALAPADRAAIVAHLPAYQRGHVDRSVALLAAGNSGHSAARFSPAIATHVAAVMETGGSNGDPGLTATTRASLLKALAQIEGDQAAEPLAVSPPRRSLIGAIAGVFTRRKPR